MIARRMKESPHTHSVVTEKDIEHVLERFEEEVGLSLIHRGFSLDTTSVTVEETLAEFEDKIERLLTDSDRLRIVTHQALRQNLG